MITNNVQFLYCHHSLPKKQTIYRFCQSRDETLYLYALYKACPENPKWLVHAFDPSIDQVWLYLHCQSAINQITKQYYYQTQQILYPCKK